MPEGPTARNWKANEIPDFAGRRYLLVVTGEVQVTATNQTSKLTEHVPQGLNPRILLLDLSIVSSSGFGGQIVSSKSVQYEKATSGNQYDEVGILFGGKIIQRITRSPHGRLGMAQVRKSAAEKPRGFDAPGPAPVKKLAARRSPMDSSQGARPVGRSS